MKKSKKARLVLGLGLAFAIGITIPQTKETFVKETDEKRVALTYDDGPNPIYTRQVLEVLKEENVPASFFLLGKSVEKYPELTKEIADQGHCIGNHTYSHINVCQLPEAAVVDEVEKTNQLIYESCGVCPELFRPPFGCVRKKLAEDMHMIPVFWDVDPKDWKVKNTDTVVNEVLKNIEDGDIILMHDAYGSTVEATKLLIPKLREMGYTFVTVDQLIQP